MKKTHIHVQFSFVSFIMFFEHDNLLSLIIYLLFIDINIIIDLSFTYVKPHRDTVFATFTSNKFMF